MPSHTFFSTELVILVASALSLLLVACQAASPPPEEPVRIYVGTGTGDADEGIYSFLFGPEGSLEADGMTPGVLNPTFLAISPDGRTLYSVNEADGEGSVTAFRIDSETGALTMLNRQPSGGRGPCYVSVDETGEWVLAANYGSGSVSLFPVEDDGRLGAAADVVQHEGSSADPERQEGPHAHYVAMGPENRYALANDLGTDETITYYLDRQTGQLQQHSVAKASPGHGPRHLAFHPDGGHAYVINELDGSITTYAYADGELTELQNVSTLPRGFDGYNKSADIHVHPSGRFVYGSNRGDSDGIAIFAVNQETGLLTLRDHQSQGIAWPRNFAIDPSGRFMLVANREADNIMVYAIDRETGRLMPTGHSADVPNPVCIKFTAGPA